MTLNPRQFVLDLGFPGDERGQHRPMTEVDDSATLDDMTRTFPDDVYTHPQYYGWGEHTWGAANVMRRARGKPDRMVNIYRAIPHGGERVIRTGDWVATTRSYAQGHADSMGDNERGSLPIIKARVPAREVVTGGNDILEYGYGGTSQVATVVHRGGLGKKRSR